MAGEGPRSTAVFSYTDEDVLEGAVQDLTVVANQVFTITATWNPPLSVLQDGVILGYEVNVTRTPVSSLYVNTAFSSTPVSSLKLSIDNINIFLHYTSTFVVTGLQSYMSYTVSMEPYTKKGNGVTSTSTATTTRWKVPPQGHHKA